LDLIHQLNQIDADLQEFKPVQQQPVNKNAYSTIHPNPKPIVGPFPPGPFIPAFSDRKIIEMELSIDPAQKIDGLLFHDHSQIETDRYLIIFGHSGMDMTIIDKCALRSTYIWGDPHFDSNDVEGDQNGKLSNPDGSDDHVTFMLMDGTTVTIKVKEKSMIEDVDIIKGNQRIHGAGQASSNWSNQNALFNTHLVPDGFIAETSIPRGYTVFAGGDGNDWYLENGILIWGRQSGPYLNNASSPKNEFQVDRNVQDSLSTHQIEKSA
jgi:hypothetical protein